MKKSQEVAVVDQQMLAELKEMYPTETGNFVSHFLVLALPVRMLWKVKVRLPKLQ